MPTLKSTNFKFPGQTAFYSGKVRDLYYFDDKVAMVATDRISAFDVILPQPIPFKGQVLNQIASKYLQNTRDIVPNWVINSPHPNVTFGYRCDPFPVEMVIRGYLAGHAWREYRDGRRTLCGVELPEGLKENDKLPEPIITPTTKAKQGHDLDISRQEILDQKLVAPEDYEELERYTKELFLKGTEVAVKQGLILVDTKYEFGKFRNKILLIDEVHTPDSSRYFYANGYETRQQNNEPQKQLSKEFVRQWLISEGFQGLEGQQIPEMNADIVNQISERYIELYETVTGETFFRNETPNIEKQIEQAILAEV